MYTGTSGDFDLVTLLKFTENGQDSWQITTYKTSGSCSGFHYFRLETPSSDPVGGYCDWDGVDKDCTRGEAAVFEV